MNKITFFLEDNYPNFTSETHFYMWQFHFSSTRQASPSSESIPQQLKRANPNYQLILV